MTAIKVYNNCGLIFVSNFLNMISFEKMKSISEAYAKMMRDNFSASFEDEKLNNLLNDLIFDDEKSLFADLLKNNIDWFKSFVYNSLWDKKIIKSNKWVKELLSQVWYDFFICKTKEDILQFKKYYKEWEALCTFNYIEDRLEKYHIFWIIKKDIDKIIHQWSNKTRQDIYWTSCCSIQVNKNNCNDISIKNRYNHSVNNCDATFGNNLNNIIDWLEFAFNNEFDFKIKKQNWFESDNTIFKNWKFMIYNYEINNIYYWINKIYKNWNFEIFDKNKFILIDYFLIDLEKKCFKIIDINLVDDFFNFKFKNIIIKKKWFKEDEDLKDTLIIYK